MTMNMGLMMPPPPVDNLWAGLNGATVFENGVYLSEGSFDLEIIRCISKKTQKSGLAFIVEVEVLSSTVSEHPVGSKRTWFQSMKNLNVGFNAVAGFLLKIFGLDNNAARKHDFFPYLEAFVPRMVTSEINILAGMYIHCECTEIKTKERQLDFTRHDFSTFDYELLAMQPPEWPSALRALSSAPVQAALPMAAPMLDPSGRFQLVNNQWVPYQAPQLPPPPPPPPAANPWDTAQKSPDGKWYLLANNVWAPIPGR